MAHILHDLNEAWEPTRERGRMRYSPFRLVPRPEPAGKQLTPPLRIRRRSTSLNGVRLGLHVYGPEESYFGGEASMDTCFGRAFSQLSFKSRPVSTSFQRVMYLRPNSTNGTRRHKMGGGPVAHASSTAYSDVLSSSLSQTHQKPARQQNAAHTHEDEQPVYSAPQPVTPAPRNRASSRGVIVRSRSQIFPLLRTIEKREVDCRSRRECQSTKDRALDQGSSPHSASVMEITTSKNNSDQFIRYAYGDIGSQASGLLPAAGTSEGVHRAPGFKEVCVFTSVRQPRRRAATRPF
ncbi:hypothetical protein GMRT_11281 [Giardia muris]|uniref:Uncharacterized protein n=1 Tax=Giardia muris TaxID=5742 RepID=A0A4Z1SR19_GIAMU|nr:hypothetical protein GMRT_11281 [Giardia muris]|eukprot:TNJ27405.1 hypothetical protein GMRT_11281 [Giardia muris]